MKSAQGQKLRGGMAQVLLAIYKGAISPLFRGQGACRFQPTCSEYAAIAVAEQGAVRGSLMAAWRVLRCNPLNRLGNGGGFDPVPAKRTEGIQAAQRTLVPQIRE
ncbi:MAG: membrane protein insertion efficiency factor YidD [Acidobacteriaceae bacterium]